MTKVSGTASSAGSSTPADSVVDEEPDQLRLGADFEAPAYADWQELVAEVLRKSGGLAGSDPDEGGAGQPEHQLATRTYDGIDIEPLYTSASAVPATGLPGLPPFVRAAKPEGNIITGWDLRQAHIHSDPAAANQAILADLEGGVNSLWLRVGSGGVPLESLAEALHGVYIDLVPFALDPGADYEQAANALLAVFAERELPRSALEGNLGADPIGLCAATGEVYELAPAAELASRLAPECPRLSTFVVDGLVYHEAGGSDSQELGAAIAAGVAYLRALTEAGMDVDAAAAQLEFRIAATADQFMTIAKLRAARRLWSRVTEVAGAGQDARGMRQHAVTSAAMLTRRDPWVNMLRDTVACFGAALGGADAITVLPFDDAIGLPDDFSLRIARNTSAILLEESKLSGVVDPAGGSWYVEKLTDELAHAAWHEFTEIERQGGIESTLDSGFLDDRLAETRRTRAQRIATRADPITGVSEYPNLDEKLPERSPKPSDVGTSGGLPKFRYAQGYEALRDRSDAYLAAHGTRPGVFLATLGPVAAHTARASFANNLFGAGGLDSIEAGPTETVDDVVAAYRASGCTVACICGTNSAYAEQAGAVATALGEAGARAVLLAGKPDPTYEGVTGFVFAGCDALEVLTSTLETLGV